MRSHVQTLHSIPGICRAVVLKSQTETDASKKDTCLVSSEEPDRHAARSPDTGRVMIDPRAAPRGLLHAKSPFRFCRRLTFQLAQKYPGPSGVRMVGSQRPTLLREI